MIHKWKTSEPAIAEHIPSLLLDKKISQEITCTYTFTKVLGVEWDANSNTFCPMISSSLPGRTLDKRMPLSHIARLYDILGWCSPVLIMPRIILERLWEDRLDWDNPVSRTMRKTWESQCGKYPVLNSHLIFHTYFPKEVNDTYTQLPGFSEASKSPYVGVVYLRAVEQNGSIHVSLVMAKTKVAPIKRLTMPRVELCGTVFVVKPLSHAAKTLNISTKQVYASGQKVS